MFANVLASLALCLASPEAQYKAAYESALNDGKPMVVLVGATWCPACRTMKNEVLPELQSRGSLEGVSLVQIDSDAQPRLAQRLLRGNSIPQLMVYSRSGNEWRARRFVGAQSAGTVEESVREALAASQVAASQVKVDPQVQPVSAVLEGEGAEVLKHKMKSLSGEEVDLSKYQGKVLLIVNTASKCGYTPQYAGLQKLHDTYADRGFAVLGFPCNQFGGQEPGSEQEIATFCEKNYGVTFPLFAKVDVNGDKQCPLYAELTKAEAAPAGAGPIKWNFEKFLIDRSGKVVRHDRSATKPDDKELTKAIEDALGAPTAATSGEAAPQS